MAEKNIDYVDNYSVQGRYCNKKLVLLCTVEQKRYFVQRNYFDEFILDNIERKGCGMMIDGQGHYMSKF